MKKLSAFLLLLAFAALLHAQVTTTPAVIEKGYTGQVVITFDPSAGNGGMASATQCYAHTGLITSDSKSNSDWKYATATWRGGDAKYKLTKVGSNWQLIIPNIYTYYGCPDNTDITALAFVFNDGPGGSREGKTTSGGDILIFLGEENTGDIWAGFTPATCQTAARPSGISQGIYYDPSDPTKVTLCTYAASKTQPAQHVFLLGDMTNWKLSNEYQLKRDGNYFWITLTGLTPGQEYRFQYAVIRADGVKKQISDLYSEKVIHPDDTWEPSQVDPACTPYPLKGADGGYVSVIQTGKPAFPWSNATLNFQRPDKNNLVIYELWVYDYTPQRSLPGLMERLDYLQNLGVNAVELMPVCEFDGNYNWGYSPNHYFALDRAYGTPEMFKQFIDACHQRGMAVIMDMVFNHATGLNPMNKLYPYGSDLANNPWFNVTAPHSDNVYEDWNHGFGPAREMFTRALQYWIDEYHVDGFRMDLSHGFCSNQANTSVENIKYYYNNAIRPRNAYFILEHWGSNMGSERPALINEGMLCWANTSNAYCQTAMGWLKEGDSFADANKDGYVSYCESHDEERMQFKARKYGNGDLITNEDARIARIAENVAFNVLLNGSHMLWQYEEIGYDFSINSSETSPNGTSSDNRCSKKPRPESYGYFTDARRMVQFEKVAQIIQLRTRLMPQVFEGNPTAQSIGTGTSLRTIQWGTNVFVAANFSATDATSVTAPAGTWFNYLSGTKLNGGSTLASAASVPAGATISLLPGELVILTGTSLPAPAIQTDYSAFSTDLEDLPISNNPSPITNPSSTKLFLNGHIYILHGTSLYNLHGLRVR